MIAVPGRAVALAAVAAVGLGAAAPARAELRPEQRLPAGVERAEVALSGATLVWTEQRASGDLRVLSAAAGARPRVLLARRSPRDEASPATELDAGPAGAALWLHAYHGNYTGEVAETFGAAVAGGPADGGLRVLLGALHRPLPERVADEEGGVAVAGDLALTLSSRYTSTGEFEDARLVGFDLTGRAGPRDFGPFAAAGWDAEGDFVARRPSQPGGGAPVVVVSRLSTGAEAYRVELPPAARYALDAAGTLVVATAGGLAWASAAEPRLHPFTAERAGAFAVAPEGGRVAYARRRGGIVVASYAGERRVVTWPLRATSLAFTGDRLAWTTDTCVAGGEPGATAAPAEPPAGRCPQHDLAVRAPARYRGGALRVRVTCWSGPAAGCRGRLGVRRRGGRRLARRLFSVRPGETATVTVRLPARRLRRVRPGHLEVEATARDAAGLTERARARTRYVPRR